MRPAWLLVALLGVPAAVAPAADPPDAEIAAAEALLDAGRATDALAVFKRLDSLRVGRCAACLVGMAEAHFRLDKPREGIAELRRSLELEPRGRTAEQARRLIDDPRRARERFAPDFSLVTLQGEPLELAQLKGQVVIVDFWATWCPPCVEAIPELKQLRRLYPGVVLLSISADEDEKEWRDFVARNAMSWPQYRDHDHRLLRLFRVNAFPTYLVIDGDGIVRQEIRGTDPQRSMAARLKTTLSQLPELAQR